jgi:CrcB protein
MSFAHLVALAVAGAIGVVVRHLSLLALGPAASPWAVAAVNLAGCAGFGWCHGYGVVAERWSPALASAVLAGFFGGFTTFSAFALDGHVLLAAGRHGTWLANTALQNLGGIAALAVGVMVGRWCGTR